jgi:alpha-beta hydrolase superfamily lysophospholipase
MTNNKYPSLRIAAHPCLVLLLSLAFLFAPATRAADFTHHALHDGTRLHLTTWPATAPLRARLLVVHGIGYHAGPYRVIADSLNRRGIEVVGIDLRGHGRSDGTRGTLAPLDTLAADVHAVLLALAGRDPATPLFLFGDSLGGVVALAAAGLDATPVKGLILGAPALDANARLWFGPNMFCAVLTSLLFHRKPVISIADQLTLGSRDPVFLEKRGPDPLAQQKVSPQYLLEFATGALRWRKELAPRSRVPILAFIGGRDKVVTRQSVLDLPRYAGGPVEVREIPEAWHTLLWDPETPRMLDEIGDWINGRSLK